MIKVVIEDENGEKFYTEVHALVGGFLLGGATSSYRPVQALTHGSPTDSEVMSAISAQLSLLVESMANKGMPDENIVEILTILVSDSIRSAGDQPLRRGMYDQERGN